MDDDQQFCLRWNNHQSTLISVFDTLLENGTLVDCTLAAEGQFLKAHKVVLSACSPYFASLLSQQYDKHPIFILKDVKFQELRAMMDYMYRGEVNISQDQLAALLKAAESLQIKGLSDSRGGGGGGNGSNATNAGSSGGQKIIDHKQPQLSVPVSVAGKSSGGISSGYTLEQKRPRHAMGPLSIDTQELAGSREGSSSPTSRKRKKIRRRSLDNIMADNHELSNSSSHSMQINSSTAPSNTSAAAATTAATSSSSSTSTTSAAAAALLVSAAATGLNVTKKTDNSKMESGVEQDMDNDDETDHHDQHQENNKNIVQMKKEQNHKRKSQVVDTENKDNSDMLIEPKSEYDDGNDETVEDLTLDEEELLDDLEQAGPSHGGEGSSQGYAQWQVDRSQDEVFLAAQEAAGQQRDPQDLRTNKSPVISDAKPATISKPSVVSTAPPSIPLTTVSMTTSTVTTAARQMLSSMKTSSTSDLSEMLLEFYKANNAMIPKNDHFQKSPSTSVPTTFAMTGPLSANSIVSAIVSSANNGVKPSSTNNTTQSTGPGSILSSVTNKLMASLPPVVHPKNLNSDEMLTNLNALATSSIIAKRLANPFHPRIKYSNVNNKSTTTAPATMSSTPVALTSTSPAVAATTNATNSREGQPPQITPTAPVAAVTAAAAAAALLRDEYHHLHQLRAQELLKQQPHGQPIPPLPPNSHFYMPNFLKNDKYAESYLSSSDEGDDDDDDDNDKYPDMEDIHLIEGTKSSYQNQAGSGAGDTDYMSDESHKYSMIAAQALRNLEYSLSDYGGGSPSEEPLYQCRHCGKKYRWKSTLRRHENVECGGKEPSHQCPYCPYKSKQRGNLGVHVRKHHSNLPQLASKRRSKYSQPRD